MTPHEALESLYNIEENLTNEYLFNAFDKDGWEYSKLLLEMKPVCFHFGSILPQSAHLEFADQLLNNDMFHFPFPYTFMTNSRTPHIALLCHQDSNVLKGSPNFINIVTLGPFNVGDNRGNIDYKEVACPLLMTYYDGEDRIRWRSLTKKGTHYSSKGDVYEERDDLANVSQNSFKLSIGYTTLLMSREVNQQIFPEPVKLNRQRLKKNKPPVGERRVITLNTNLSNQGEVKNFQSGRKSPIMHWRRGHIRNQNGRLIPIAPTIVNARDDSIPEPKTYRFVQG